MSSLITTPLELLLPYQARWVAYESRFKAGIWSRQSGKDFSTAAEALGLLIAFELLQESGVHLPQAIGQSVSTIGGIVVGTAAVEAGLIRFIDGVLG